LNPDVSSFGCDKTFTSRREPGVLTIKELEVRQQLYTSTVVDMTYQPKNVLLGKIKRQPPKYREKLSLK